MDRSWLRGGQWRFRSRLGGYRTLGPLDLLLRPVKMSRSDDLDTDAEFRFQRGDLTSPSVLEGIGQLRVQRDPHPLDVASYGPRFDPAQEIEPHHLRTGDPSCALACGAWTMSSKV